MSELKQDLKTSFALSMQPRDFTQIVKSIGSLVEEATIYIDEEGLTFRGMDPSHVAMLDIAIPNGCFEKYEIRQEGSIGVRVDELLKICKQLDKKQSVRLETKPEFILEIKQGDMSLKLRTIETTKTDTPLPKIPYDARVEIDGMELKPAEFVKHLKRIETVSDYVTFETNPNELIVSGKGDSGDIKINLDDVRLDVKQDSTSTYSLEYILPFVKTLDKNSELIIAYSTAKPCRLETKITNIGRVHFYLAPRVEN